VREISKVTRNKRRQRHIHVNIRLIVHLVGFIEHLKMHGTTNPKLFLSVHQIYISDVVIVASNGIL
jgi:hypothetical protein